MSRVVRNPERQESREPLSHVLICSYLLNLQRAKKQLGQKPTPSFVSVPRNLGPVSPHCNQRQPCEQRGGQMRPNDLSGEGQSGHHQERAGSRAWVPTGLVGARRDTGCTGQLRAATPTHTPPLLPFSFVTHPAGPSTENVKLLQHPFPIGCCSQRTCLQEAGGCPKQQQDQHRLFT